MKAVFLFLVLGLVSYAPVAQAQNSGGGVLGFLGGIIRGGPLGGQCNCKCGVANSGSEQTRSLPKDIAKDVPIPIPIPIHDPKVSDEIAFAIKEDAMFTELVSQAEEAAQKCDCDKSELKSSPTSAPVDPTTATPVVAPVPEVVVKKQEEVPAKVPVKSDKKEEVRKARLLAGDTPPPHAFPWLAIVQILGREPAAGGALITDRHILTAATPLQGLSAQTVKVSLGVHDRCDNDATSTNYSVEAIRIHPSFSPTEPAHDLALLTLAASIKFDSRVSPICLPPAATTFQGQVATIVSWQEPVVDEPPGCLPKRLHLPVLRREECIKGLTSPNLLTPEKSCIGTFASNTVVCPGDVGTPVQYELKGKHFLLGIMSNTNTCGDNTSTLFTRVADHLNWVQASTREDCYCNRN